MSIEPPATPTGPAARSGALVAILLGLAVGGLLVWLALRADHFAGLRNPEIEIGVNGLSERMGRDLLLPTWGWVLQIRLPEGLPESVRETLEVTLRAERTGATIEVADRLRRVDGVETLVIPKSMGLHTGLLSVKASLEDASGRRLEGHRRLRIRTWLGGPPIGARQVVHFDFEVDHDGDGRPDLLDDLERFGLATPDRPDLARRVAERIARRALERVERAYDDRDDPNGTGAARDPVFVRFVLAAEPGPYVTRICVGGANPDHPGSVGYVRFDLRNERRRSQECGGEPAAGLFPAELTRYAEDPIYLETFGPFLPEQGGRPVGSDPGDAEAVARTAGEPTRVDRPGDRDGATTRGDRIALAIARLGDALGTVMAHESAHALGLVPAGKPGVGLFGSGEQGERFAHNLDARGGGPSGPWLMNPGDDLGFPQLVGLGPQGELRFRPLNYAYLKDRLVLAERRR